MQDRIRQAGPVRARNQSDLRMRLSMASMNDVDSAGHQVGRRVGIDEMRRASISHAG
jgi:hypothetical protein